MIRAGFEIEFLSLGLTPSERERIRQSGFNLGLDISTHPKNKWEFAKKKKIVISKIGNFIGREIRTREPFCADLRCDELSPEFTSLFEVLNRVKKNNKLFITHLCGIHFHFSTDIGTLNVEKIREKFHKYNFANKARETNFCIKESTTSKYNAVRIITPCHIEFRSFNATLNLSVVNKWFKIARKLTLENIK